MSKLPIPPLVLPFIKLQNPPCDSKNYDDIENALSRIMAKDLRFPLIFSTETIWQLHFTKLILKLCEERFDP